MAKENLKGKLETIDTSQLLQWLKWIGTGGTTVMVATFVLYFMNFNEGLSADHARWGTFGDFVGGALNPILSFLALIALLLTVALQSRQTEISKKELELSRKELEATRQELARSAAAQEKTEKAQLKQAHAQEIAARIAAISQFLLLEEEVIRRITSSFTGSAEGVRRQTALQNKNELIEELRRLYQKLGSVDDEP